MKIERINEIANSMKDMDGKIAVNKLLERLSSISFWELLSEVEKLEIPIIQRDYAHGRSDYKTTKIRDLFLDSLIKAIHSENESLELDFVYGDINNGIFQPLDGQQRLTTLYLVYWYYAYKTGNLSKNKNQFKKFTYETRISSREFCNELVEKGEHLGLGDDVSLIEKITDTSWFFLSWKKDPTINAVLVMLDSIESKLKSKNEEELKMGWYKLISENPPITFHFKQLNDIGLTDDLYIKMNARGKALTDFENFKARFEKHIKENEFENDLVLNEANKDQWEKLTKETFSHRIDTVWTDLFWKHRGSDHLVDNKFVKFIAGIAINAYAMHQEIEEELRRKILEEKKGKNITDEAVKRKCIERRIKLLLDDPNEITPEDFPSETSFKYLKSCFDLYSDKGFKRDELKPKLALWDFLSKEKKLEIKDKKEPIKSLFIEFVQTEKLTTYKQRVLFYAQTRYLEVVKKEFNSKAFTDWMRVVRNIVQNATIDSAETFIRAIGLINKLSRGCKNIYEHLNEISPTEFTFASSQLKEEISKANLIQQDYIWSNQIFKVEDDDFLKGEISFLLEYAKKEKFFDYRIFKDLSDNFLQLFTLKDDSLRMALLIQDDYPIPDGIASSLGWAYRYSLLHTENEWKDALRKKHPKLINAISKLLENTSMIEGSRIDKLNAIIDNYNSTNDYRDIILRHRKHLAYCWHKRFCLNEDHSILYLLEKTKVVGDNYKKLSLIK